MDDIVQQFDAFWFQYPRKQDKIRALKAFRTALKGRPATKTRPAEEPATLADILLGLAHYRFSPYPEYIPLAATWLNNRRWIPAEFTQPETVVTTPSRSSWRDQYDQPITSNLSHSEVSNWKHGSQKRPVTIQGEIFSDD